MSGDLAERERISAAGAAPTRRRDLAPKEEAPTWALLGLCYAVWAAALWFHDTIGFFPFAVSSALSVALHLSLQHEALHGHPTRSAALNEALVFPSLNGLIPFRRFRDTHLRHHCDERLTDPLDDPETWYLAEREALRLSPLWRLVMNANRSIAGRLVLGPPLGVFGMWRADWREGGPRIRGAYLRHAAAATIVFGYVWGVCGVNPLVYLAAAAWPGMAIIMLRAYCEHRAAEAFPERTVVVEAEPFFQLMFLNNNLHAVHHAYPNVAWYRLPEIWRRERDEILARNGDYRFAGYFEIIRRWLFRAKEPLAHPHLRRD